MNIEQLNILYNCCEKVVTAKLQYSKCIKQNWVQYCLAFKYEVFFIFSFLVFLIKSAHKNNVLQYLDHQTFITENLIKNISVSKMVSTVIRYSNKKIM